MRLKLFPFSFLILLFVLLPTNFAKAIECSAVWDEYKCESGACGGRILKRTCHQYCCKTCESCKEVCDEEGNCRQECYSYCCGCCTTCDSNPTVFDTCDAWQTCQDGGGWSRSVPSCKCTGSCLERPKNLKYYADPNKTISQNSSNIFLPVKFDWDNVPGWYKKDYTLFPSFDVVTPLPEEEVEKSPPPQETPPPSAISPPKIEGEISLEVPMYYQNVPKTPGSWYNFHLSSVETIGSVGCIITSFAMVMKYFGGDFTPLDLGKFVKEKGLWTFYGLRTQDFLDSFRNLKFPYYKYARTAPNIDDIVEHLKNGRPVVAQFLNYMIPNQQHWIVIRGVTKDGNFIVNDPLWAWQQKHGGILKRKDLENFQLKSIIWFEKTLKPLSLNDFKSFTSLINDPPDNSEAPSSYLITIEGTTLGTYTAVVDTSEFIPPSCLLKSGFTHKIKIQACCNPNGTNCGPSLVEQFTTNRAPELISPPDPDWLGPRKLENVKRDDLGKLSWCQVEDPNFYQEISFGGTKYYRPLSYRVLIYYSEKDLCHPRLLSQEGKCIPELLTSPPGQPFPPPEFLDENYFFFTRSTSYAWKVQACRDTFGTECTDFSQLWRFSSADFSLPKPELVSPPNDKNMPIGLPVLLQWKSPFANSFIYEVGGSIKGITTNSSVSLDYPKLSLDTVYSWKVKPCWDYEGKNCENIWSDTFYFKTTGAPPELISPISNANNVPIPTTFKWKEVPGAKSYRIKIAGVTPDEGIVTSEKTERVFGYPDLKQTTTYSWQVKTCADREGKICGKNWSGVESFTTFKLPPPTNPSLKDKEEVFTYQMPRNISWDPVPYAKAYKFTLTYLSKSPEEVSDCPTGKVDEKIVSGPSVFVSLNCLGEYQWQVASCLDENCKEIGESSPVWHFTFSQPKGVKKGGLVPCGRMADDPETPWNEREPCEIKHIFLLIKIIIDFLLWNLTPLVLVALVAVTGVIFYFLSWDPNVLNLVKSIWKAVGIGILIMLLSWTIITIFMSILGYKVGVYGPWWKFSF